MTHTLQLILPRSMSKEDAIRCPQCGSVVWFFPGCCMDVECEAHCYRQDLCISCLPKLDMSAEEIAWQRKHFDNLPETWLDCKLSDVLSSHRLHWFRAKYPVVEKAHQFAQKAHEGQVRKFGGKPFFSHPERVAWRVAVQASRERHPVKGALPWEFVVAAALLHDVLEDTDCTKDMLLAEFPEPVVILVLQLTNVKIAGLTREQQKAEDHLRLKWVSNEAKLVKLCDRIDNMLELEGAPKVFVKKYRAETKHLLETVFSTELKQNAYVGGSLAHLTDIVRDLLDDRETVFFYEGDGPSGDPLN